MKPAEQRRKTDAPADRCANIDAAPPALLPETDGKGVTNREARNPGEITRTITKEIYYP